MELKKLIADLPLQVHHFQEIVLTGITANSKNVKKGGVFIAKRGKSYDGNAFSLEAVQAGAGVVVSDCYNPDLQGVVQLIHPDTGNMEEVLVARFYDHPAEKLFLVGITGTNGKTTTSFLVQHLLQPCGLIGTVQWRTGKQVMPATHTTPDFIKVTELLCTMLNEQCQSAVMEVSSHALDQGRVKGIPFDVAVFTNLTQDHLDYHATMQQYAAAKQKLFTSLKGVAVVNADDPWHWTMIEQCSSPILTYGFEGQVRASDVRLSAQGMQLKIVYAGQIAVCDSKLIGRFNVYNLLAAAAVGLSFGLDLETIAHRLATFEQVPGRLERVPNSKNLNIFVDYAHTEDALKNVLETLLEIKQGRLITLFGCGGNRDTGKRPKMGAIAEALSDVVIVTSDNPRQEDPEAIIREIVAGFVHQKNYQIEIDRKAAIHRAIAMARPEDIVLIAGKGHEQTQVFKDQTLPFNDREVARQACIT